MGKSVKLLIGLVAAGVAMVFVVVLLNTPPDFRGPDLSGDLPDCEENPKPADC